MRLRLASLSLTFLAVVTCRAHAQDDPVMNYRDKCRKSASGAYSVAYADLGLAQDAVVLADRAKKRANAVLENHEAKLRLVDKRLQEKDYPAELLRERDSLGGQIKLYHEQYSASEEQDRRARQDLEKTKKRHDQLRSKLEPLFQLLFTDDPDGGNRKIFHRLEWKSPCPKYRSLCPLPSEQTTKLTSLMDDIDDVDLACHRYSKLK